MLLLFRPVVAFLWALFFGGSLAFQSLSAPFTFQIACTDAGGTLAVKNGEPQCKMESGRTVAYSGPSTSIRPDAIGVSSKNMLATAIGAEVAVAAEGDIKEPDFSSWPDASRYRTRITKAMQSGGNFAEHYAVARWGCGDDRSCKQYAIVDVKTGKIVTFGLETRGDDEWSKDSRTFVVNASSSSPKYFEITTDGTWHQIAKNDRH